MKAIRPTDCMEIKQSIRLEPGTYVLPRGITVANDGVELHAEGVVLVGERRDGRGVTIRGRRGVRISGMSLREYYHGVYADNCEGFEIQQCRVTSTAEIAPNTVFLDIWLPADRCYGGGICLVNCNDATITENDLQHQMCGLLCYGCANLTIAHNQCSYNSGFGIYLHATCDSLFEENCCDFCCRFERREGGPHHGHMGADSAGFAAVMNSSRNRFSRNTARLGGDGFFLAGLSPSMMPCGCNENVFEENDGSLSPNIAFEATFCMGNIFRRNVADRCNYGFWQGYSKDCVIEDNQVLFNRQAGVAAENGVGFRVIGNQFQSNGHGVLLWSRFNENFMQAYLDRDTSRDWLIERNRFLKNGCGIMIAADRDHGIRALPPEERKPATRPRSHCIIQNDIQDNRIGISLHSTDGNTVRQNTLNANVEANLRLEDSCDNTIADNLGSQGAYL